MKLLLITSISVLLFSSVVSQERYVSFSLGLNYRSYPIDIEDVPQGGYSSNGLPDNEKFWKALSLSKKIGLHLRKNW